jgi:hypothetical protein
MLHESKRLLSGVLGGLDSGTSGSERRGQASPDIDNVVSGVVARLGKDE